MKCWSRSRTAPSTSCATSTPERQIDPSVRCAARCVRFRPRRPGVYHSAKHTGFPVRSCCDRYSRQCLAGSFALLFSALLVPPGKAGKADLERFFTATDPEIAQERYGPKIDLDYARERLAALAEKGEPTRGDLNNYPYYIGFNSTMYLRRGKFHNSIKPPNQIRSFASEH